MICCFELSLSILARILIALILLSVSEISKLQPGQQSRPKERLNRLLKTRQPEYKAPIKASRQPVKDHPTILQRFQANEGEQYYRGDRDKQRHPGVIF